MSWLWGRFHTDSKRSYQRCPSPSNQQGQHSPLSDLPFPAVQAAQCSHDPEAHGLREAHGRSGPGGEWVPWAQAFTRALCASARADQQIPHGQRDEAAAIFGSEYFGNCLLLEYGVITSLSGLSRHVLGRCQHGAYVSSGLWFLLLCVYVTSAASDNFTRGLKQNNKWALSPTCITSLGAHWFSDLISNTVHSEGKWGDQLKCIHMRKCTHMHAQWVFFSLWECDSVRLLAFSYCLSAGVVKTFV